MLFSLQGRRHRQPNHAYLQAKQLLLATHHPPSSGARFVQGIDGLAWINLDRCTSRRAKMEERLQHISHVSTKVRVSAIDGRDPQLAEQLHSYPQLENPTRGPLTTPEIACALSHVRALCRLKSMFGQHPLWPTMRFLVLEDDVSFWPWELFGVELSRILAMAPADWSVVKLHTIVNSHFATDPALFRRFDPRNSSASAYVISGPGIDRVLEACRVDDDNVATVMEPLTVSDAYIFHHAGKTYDFKYNVVETANEDSTIHTNHIEIHATNSLLRLEMLLKDRQTFFSH